VAYQLGEISFPPGSARNRDATGGPVQDQIRPGHAGPGRAGPGRAGPGRAGPGRGWGGLATTKQDSASLRVIHSGMAQSLPPPYYWTQEYTGTGLVGAAAPVLAGVRS